MSKFVDRRGMRYGYLKVIRKEEINRRGEWTWRCRCGCGDETVVVGSSLSSGNTQSCGCKSWNAGGMSDTLLYARWQSMLNRCQNPKSYKYPRFGGRGIIVCQRWSKSFRSFYEDMGDPPEGYQLARKDLEDHFTPENCHWIPSKNAHLKNDNFYFRMVEFNGREQCVTDWAKELGVSPQFIFARLNRGWSAEKALSTPKGQKPIGGKE